MSLKSKEQSKAESRIEKVLSTHDSQVCEGSNDCRKLVDMEVTSPPNKSELPIATLTRPDNMACLLTVRKFNMTLVSEFNWSWRQAIQRTMPDSITTRIQSLKESITNATLSDDIKYQTSITFYIQQECNLTNPVKAQKLHMMKMKRFFYKMKTK